MNAHAMTFGDNNHVAGGECRRIENRERQRFAGVGDDLGGCVTQGYLTEDAIRLRRHGIDVTRSAQSRPAV